MTDPHIIHAITTCTSSAELRGLLDALKARGVELTDAQVRAAQVKRGELLADEKRRGWRR